MQIKNIPLNLREKLLRLNILFSIGEELLFLLLLIEANHFTNVHEKFKLYKISPHDVRTCLYKIGKDY